MRKNELPKKVVLTFQQAKALEKRISHKVLNDQDVETLLGLLSFNLWIQDQLSRAKLTIKRLKSLFGFSSESRKKTNNEQGGNNHEKMSADASMGTDTVNHQDLKNWDPSQNHGRYGVDDYTGCPLIEVPLQTSQLAQGKCPDCAVHETNGKLYTVDPSFVVLLDSKSLVFGERYQLERARCGVCQAYYTASLPEEFAHRPKYSHQCLTSIAIYHYYAGVPFKRLEMLQAAQGVPLPDSTQYDLMNQLYQGVIEPVARTLRSCAANGNTLYFDDTRARMLEQTILNQQATTTKGKKAIHATALLSDYQDHRIYLFDTNTQTAGKQLKRLLSARTIDDTFTTMSDASASNFPLLDDPLMARWVISLCLSHGRRRFVELLADQDEDLVFILDLIAKVYINDRHCKEKRLSPARRLQYHQQHSAPVMAAMYTWFNNLLLFKQVEPNSRFGEAILYMLKRWEWLTQFLQKPGAPLDNNICEQAIKVMIRYRNNSLFYRTFYGATIGDAMMSVLHTAINAGVNVFDYLNTLQENATCVQNKPERWLPWNYQETLIAPAKQLSDELDSS